MSLLLKAVNYKKQCCRYMMILRRLDFYSESREHIESSYFCAGATVKQLRKNTLWRTGEPQKTFFLENTFLRRLLSWIPKRCYCHHYTLAGTYKELCESIGWMWWSFFYLWSKCPKLRDAKVQQGLTVDPQIWEVMFDKNFERNWTSLN
jgi:hypothetical protein